MSWIRLDCDFFVNDEICEQKDESRMSQMSRCVTAYAVTSVIAYVKLHGVRGIAKATSAQIARAMVVPEEFVIAALKTSFFSVEGKTIQVLKWKQFQIDPGAAERKKRQRNDESVSHGCHSDNRDMPLSRLHGHGQYIIPPYPPKGDEAAEDEAEDDGARAQLAAEFMRVCPRAAGQNWSILMAKVGEDCEEFGADRVREAIKAVGVKANHWGLVSCRLRGEQAVAEIESEADADVRFQIEETRQRLEAKRKAKAE